MIRHRDCWTVSSVCCWREPNLRCMYCRDEAKYITACCAGVSPQSPLIPSITHHHFTTMKAVAVVLIASLGAALACESAMSLIESAEGYK